MASQHTELFLLVGVDSEEEFDGSPTFAYAKVNRDYLDRLIAMIDAVRAEALTDPKLYCKEYWSSDLKWACERTEQLERAEMVDVRSGTNVQRLIESNKVAFAVPHDEEEFGELCETTDETMKVFGDSIEFEAVHVDGNKYYRTSLIQQKVLLATRKLLAERPRAQRR